jgi:DNA-binding GntR family transcriptional regulator
MDSETLEIKHQRVADLVLEQLMDWIMSGRIHMGQKLNTEELSKQLGVSRMPVREALKTLEKQGIVESIPYVGSRVVKLTKDDIRQIYIIRKALEPIAAYYTCQRITKDEIENIERIQVILEDELQKENPSAKQIYIENRRFHFAIYNISNMTKLCDMIRILWDNLAFYKLIYGLTYVNDKKFAVKMIEQHRQYIDALKKNDCEMLKMELTEELERHENDVPYRVSTYIDDCIND